MSDKSHRVLTSSGHHSHCERLSLDGRWLENKIHSIIQNNFSSLAINSSKHDWLGGGNCLCDLNYQTLLDFETSLWIMIT
jgi:hypothetical protein